MKGRGPQQLRKCGKGLVRGEEPRSLAEAYPPNSVAAPGEPCSLPAGRMRVYYSSN